MLVLKDVLRPRLEPGSSGGGRVPTRQVPYRQHKYLTDSTSTLQTAQVPYRQQDSCAP